MNASKRNYNGWILCPSKSFPGKSYYFNVLNGEAAWNLDDVEKNSMQGNFHKVTDRWHTYPEPDSPPVEDPTFNWQLKKPDYNYERPIPVGHTVGPTFAQTQFQKSQGSFDPNVVWIPVPKPTTSNTDCHYKTWNMNTDRQFLQTCPPTKRHVWYDKPPSKMQENVFNSKVFDTNSKWPNFDRSTPVFCQPHIFQRSCQTFGQKPEIFRNTQFEKKPEYKPMLQRPVLNRMPKEYEYQINEPIQQPKTTENQTLANPGFGLWTSPIKGPAFSRFRNKSETHTYQNSEHMSKLIEKTTDDDTGFGIWTSPKKKVQISHSEHYPTKNLIFPNFEHPGTLNVFDLSPTKKSKTQSELNIGIEKSLQTKSTFNVPQSTGNFTSSPVKKAQFPQFLEELTNTQMPKQRVQNSVTAYNRGNMTVKKECNLGTNDLRYRLLAKKRKSEHGDVKQSCDCDKGKRKSQSNDMEEAVAPKKRVTFNLGVEESVQGVEVKPDEDMFDQEPQDYKVEHTTIETLKNLAAPTMNADLWYIVVDTETLLEDHEFLNAYVQTDEQCSLLIPSVTKAEIEAMSCGACLGRPRAMHARQVSRLLSQSLRHITVLPADDQSAMPTDDALINCCIQMIYQNYHVVLIVKDTKLYNKAKRMNIHCFELQEIKDGASVPKPEITFELKKIQNSFQNSRITDKNQVFAKIKNENNPFALSGKGDIPVNHFGKGLFDGQRYKQAFFYQSNNPIEQKEIKKTDFGKGLFDGQKYEQSFFYQDNNPIEQKEIKKTDFGKGLFDGQKYEQSFFYQNNNPIEQKEIKKTDTEKNITFFPPKIMQPNKKDTIEDETTDLPITSQINTELLNLNLNESFNFQNSSPAENKETLFKKPEEKNHQPLTHNISSVIRKIKSINSYNIDEHLRRFYVKNKCVKEKIRSRMEEWICCYTQIMEDVLSDVLQDTSSVNQDMAPPWTLSEALECLAELCDNTSLKIITDKLMASWLNHSDVKGVLKATVSPNDFIKILGCGVLLIKWLKQTILPQSTALTDAEESLTRLIEIIEDPTDPEPLVAQAPVSDCYEDTERKNFVKKSSEVLMYLKQHFPEWETYSEPTADHTTKDTKPQLKPSSTKIVRTYGRNLNQLKLDNNKSMILNQTKTTNTPNQDSTESDTKTVEKVTTTVLNRFPQMKTIDLVKRETVNKDILNMIDHIVKGEVHTFYYKPKPSEKKVRIVLTDCNKKDIDEKPENVEEHELKNIIDERKEKELDLDVLDYNEIDDVTSQMTVVNDDVKQETKKLNEKNEEQKKCCDENDVDVSNDTTNDSGFENGSQQAHSLVQTFLMELSESFEIVYNFIDTSISECREKDVQEETRLVLLEKADKTHARISEIIDKLKSIIARESSEGTTMKKLLEKVGVQMSTDKHYIRYSQVITKCLEQAQILESALKIMLTLDDESDSTSTVMLSIDSNIQYYNIFEN